MSKGWHAERHQLNQDLAVQVSRDASAAPGVHVRNVLLNTNLGPETVLTTENTAVKKRTEILGFQGFPSMETMVKKNRLDEMVIVASSVMKRGRRNGRLC